MKSNPLLHEPGDLHKAAAAKPAAVPIPRRIGGKILRELRSALPPTIFFFVGFNFIVLTTNLLVASYAVAVSSFMLATVAALVVGKAVITANSMPFLKIFDRAPLIQPILFKTAIYFVAVVIARLGERFLHFLVDGNSPLDFGEHLIAELLLASLHRHLALDLRAVPDLCDRGGVQPAHRTGRNAAALFRLSAVRAAVEQAPARPRADALEPARR